MALTSLVHQAEEEQLPVRSYWRAHDHLWSFHDIRSIVSSDLAIFGHRDNPTPAISLKLREDGAPINVLTGMDLWLDNLMCHVPEVMMSYHVVSTCVSVSEKGGGAWGGVACVSVCVCVLGRKF